MKKQTSFLNKEPPDWLSIMIIFMTLYIVYLFQGFEITLIAISSIIITYLGGLLNEKTNKS